ncbi:MAG: hypothetical protein ACI4HI_14865 [Lachnospiraceae bacterium]
MLSGVYYATKKDGTPYYRSSITYQNKHISLGSYQTEDEAHLAYIQANQIVTDPSITIEQLVPAQYILTFDRIVSLLNFRDNHIYFKTPIYLRSSFFHYYLTPKMDLKFDTDDLFYYSSHRILQRNGHLYVNDYGMQYSILERYGIKSYSVKDRDYRFVNGDSTDFRYSNIEIINRYYGVIKETSAIPTRYKTRIHINGYFVVGSFPDEVTAAIAYNKAVDLAKDHGILRNFPENYIIDLSPREYADIYTSLQLSNKYLSFLKNCKTECV